MFDFTVCVLYNPAPPPFAVSKYASVTLPLKPVLCDKGCALRRDWNAKFPWVTVSPVSGALIRNPPLVSCESCENFGPGDTGQTRPPEKHLPLSEPPVVKTSSLRAENKEKRIKLGLARSRPHSFQEHGQWYLQSRLQAWYCLAVWPLGNYFMSAYPTLLKNQRHQRFREMPLNGTLSSRSCSQLAFRCNAL